VSLIAERYRASCITGVENYVAAARRSLERVEEIHAIILRRKFLYGDDRSKRRALLRNARQCVKNARESLAEAEAEYERVVGLPVSEFE
jgi:hypothetical protein